MISVEGLVVDSVWEAVRHIGNTMPGASATLFALTIGINTYKYERRPELPNLVGCVADADAIVEYLTTKLHVPKDHIACLRDSHATRANIIQSLVDLSEDPRIEKKKGDAILIFYAGHGGTAIAPSGWPAKGSDVIEMILPHDFFPGTNDKPECQGLHDITLGALLSQLAQMKGNNITVILDSCHSGSGTRTAATEVSSTRAAFNVRGADLPPDYKILPAVDQELLRHLASSRKANALNTSTSDLYSHVLLAGTSARGVALEDRILKRGVFTSAVLNLLERTSPDHRVGCTGNVVHGPLNGPWTMDRRP
ncbi:peptidase C14, caspase domain-containing protein [Mycena leptocephala]|nr:peptidase C14, caspase domain-containing protein [Mycena leptocephala]